MAKASTKGDACPCRSGKAYADCCAMPHAGLPATSPEALMRSRYAAFVMGLESYLLDTWHPSTRPADIRLLRQDPAPKWLGLDVRRSSTAGDRGEVEFVARWRAGGGAATRLHETSRFVREGGRWYYVDGDQEQTG